LQTLKEIKLPNSLLVLGNYCFYKSTLKCVVMSDDIKIIPEFCFGECKELHKIILPKNLKNK